MPCTRVLTLLAAAAAPALALQPLAPLSPVRAAAVPHAPAARSQTVVMGRKGRPTMPKGGNFNYGAQQQQARAPDPPADGSTLFYLYCRTGPGKPWYPVSAMKGDGQSKGLISAWLGAPFGKSVFKDRLDEGMARSIFDSERRLAGLAIDQYAQLRDFKARLNWGFKIIDRDLMIKEEKGEIEKQKIVPVDKSMLKEGLLDQAKGFFDGSGKSSGKEGAGEGFLDQAKGFFDGIGK